MTRIRLSLILITIFILSGCTPSSAAPNDFTLSGSLQAWVDAPLDGTVLELPALATIICHGTHSSGIKSIEASINGSILATSNNPTTEETLYTAEFQWAPEQPGMYTIECRAESAAGEWSNAASVRVIVRQQLEMTETITPTRTEISTLTPTATLIPTSTFTPTLTITPTSTPKPTGITFTNRISTNTFQYQRDCIPNPPEVTIDAVLSDAANVKYVFLFFRLESGALGITTDWNTGMPMIKTSNGVYSVTVNWRDIPQLPQIYGSSATFAYQFVAVGMDNSNIGRSQGFRDITLSPCN